MGVSSSRGKRGISQYEVYTLIGVISGIFDDVTSGVSTPENARSVINFHIARLGRHSYPSPTTGPSTSSKIFQNGDQFLEISEKYYDLDGSHAWSLVIQMRPGNKILKIL